MFLVFRSVRASVLPSRPFSFLRVPEEPVGRTFVLFIVLLSLPAAATCAQTSSDEFSSSPAPTTADATDSLNARLDPLLDSKDSPSSPPPLPSLSTVLEHAKQHAPQLAVQEAVISEQEYALKQARKRWMQSLTFKGNASYGTFGNKVLEAVELGQRAEIGIQISLFDVLSHDDAVNIQRKRLESAEAKQRALTDALHKKVIAQYYKARRARESTVVESRRYTAIQAQLQMAKSSFRQGTMSINKISQVTAEAAKAEVKFRTTRLQYKQAYKQLERLIGTELETLRSSDTKQASTSSSP